MPKTKGKNNTNLFNIIKVGMSGGVENFTDMSVFTDSLHCKNLVTRYFSKKNVSSMQFFVRHFKSHSSWTGKWQLCWGRLRSLQIKRWQKVQTVSLFIFSRNWNEKTMSLYILSELERKKECRFLYFPGIRKKRQWHFILFSELWNSEEKILEINNL